MIYYYSDALGQAGAVDERHEPEWELFDLEKDPCEKNNVYGAQNTPPWCGSLPTNCIACRRRRATNAITLTGIEKTMMSDE